jgi:hypothetical protein
MNKNSTKHNIIWIGKTTLMKQKKKTDRTESTLEKIERDNKERRQTKGQ